MIDEREYEKVLVGLVAVVILSIIGVLSMLIKGVV